MKLIDLNVREMNQSGGNWVVIFRASLLLAEDDPVLLAELISLADEFDREYEERAYQSILNGFRSVLTPRNWGAVVTVFAIRTHIVDFKERMFEKFAAQYLEKALAGADESDTNQ